MSLDFYTTWQGMDRVLGKLSQANPIYAKPFRAAMNQAWEIVSKRAHERAPRESGATEEGLGGRIDARSVPLWATVTLAGAPKGGFRYPWVVEAGRRRPKGQGYASIGRYTRMFKPTIILHYRSGPRLGRKTRGWFKGSLTGAKKRIDALLTKAAREIESQWQH